MQAHAMKIKGTSHGMQQISYACAGTAGKALRYHYCGNFHSALHYGPLLEGQNNEHIM